eukprot:5388273-Prymnesium_polylepis.1
MLLELGEWAGLEPERGELEVDPKTLASLPVGKAGVCVASGAWWAHVHAGHAVGVQGLGRRLPSRDSVSRGWHVGDDEGGSAVLA